MKKSILISAAALLAASALAADSTPKDEVTGAAKMLGEKANYSWKTTVVVPEDAPFRPGPTDGKTEKDGFTHIKMSLFENTMQVFMKGEKATADNPDGGGWQSLAEMEQEEGPGRFRAIFVRNLKTPAAQAVEIASYAKELKKDGDVFASDLTEEGTKKLLTFRAPGGEGPTVSNAKGSAKFWVKDGALVKYEFKLKGTVNFNGNEFENDRTTTVEIKDVGTTKIEVPEAAKKKLS